MSFSHEYNVPMYISTGAVLRQGDTSNLVAGQLGLFNNKTHEVVTGSLSDRQDVFLASGSWHKKDKLNKFWGGLQMPDRTVPFLGKDVFEFHRSKPREAQSEQWVIGWDGVNDCDSLTFECGKSYTFKVKVWGEDVYGTFLRPIDRFITINTGCCEGDDCSDSCEDGVPCKQWSKELAKAINEDPELQYFVRAEAISSDYVAPTATHRIYRLVVCDNGDPSALAAVQQQYPTYSISRVDRAGSTSVYEVCLPIATGVPDDFEPTSDILQAVCGVCPAGYTAAPARDVYIVTRPLAGTENLATDAAKQTYATNIGTAYGSATVQEKFLSQNGSVATVQFKVPVGTVLTALLADTLVKVATTDATCTPTEDAEPIEWSTIEDRYKVTRTLCLTLERGECASGDRLAELEAFYANVPNVVPGSLAVRNSGECSDVYEIEQYNNDCLIDGCLSEDVPQFDAFQSFDGFAWDEDCPCDVVAPGAPGVLCGVRVEAAYEDTRFGGCSFDPVDYYSVRPLKLEITEFDDSGIACATPVPSRKIRNSSMPTQSGEYIVREYIRSNVYRAYGEFNLNPRLREALDGEMHEIIDRNKFYNIYYLKVQQNRSGMNPTNNYSPEIFEFRIALEVGKDATELENLIESFTAKYGVVLQDR